MPHRPTEAEAADVRRAELRQHRGEQAVRSPAEVLQRRMPHPGLPARKRAQRNSVAGEVVTSAPRTAQDGRTGAGIRSPAAARAVSEPPDSAALAQRKRDQAFALFGISDWLGQLPDREGQAGSTPVTGS